MPWREANRRRRLLRPKSGGGPCGGDGEKRRAGGGDPPRVVRILQPEERASHLHGGLSPHQGTLRRKRHRLLGDHHRKQYRRLQGRRRSIDRPPRENSGYGIPVRGDINGAYQDQNGRNMEDTRRRLQCAWAFR